MDACLEYTGHTLIPFDDHSYRWVSVKRFVWDGTGDDADVLATLIGHRRYRDHYATSDSHEQDAGDIHGPYWVAAVTPAEFVPVGLAGAEAAVREFCELYNAPPRPEVREQVTAVALSQLSHSAWYRLRDLPEAIHDWGCVLMEFRELVAISRDFGEVLLVVMAID